MRLKFHQNQGNRIMLTGIISDIWWTQYKREQILQSLWCADNRSPSHPGTSPAFSEHTHIAHYAHFHVQLSFMAGVVILTTVTLVTGYLAHSCFAFARDPFRNQIPGVWSRRKICPTSGLLNVRSKFPVPALGISEKCRSEGSKERHLPANQKIQKQSSHFVKQHAIFCKSLVEILLTDAAPAAWKAVRCGYMWYRSKTAEARRKPVLIDRFHLTHPQPC